MEYNYNLSFDELSSEAQGIIYEVIEQICENIRKYNIDMGILCKELEINHDDFMDSLINPRNDYSGYLDVLDKINTMLGRC